MSQRSTTSRRTVSLSDFIYFLFKTPLADVMAQPQSNSPEEAELCLQNESGMMLKTFRSSHTPVERPAFTITNDETEYWGESAYANGDHGIMGMGGGEYPMGSSSLNRSRFGGARQRTSFESSTQSSTTPSSPSSTHGGPGWMSHQDPYGTHSRNTSMVGLFPYLFPIAWFDELADIDLLVFFFCSPPHTPQYQPPPSSPPADDASEDRPLQVYEQTNSRYNVSKS
ncbi:hypothetical protein FRC15_004476 [Serendipita sp. 397]|nr:hypothetical protein FRC15_004476 [Serendipita sp. 397]